jgi:hypothetical protein
MKIKLSSLLIFILFTKLLFGQWTTNTNLNTVVCDTNGEQALVKIALCPDGSSYMTWFDSRNGGYAVYIQKLDVNGYRQFPSAGILVSNNPQNSSLVDYSLIADENSNAIVTFTDIRNGGSINPFAYKISPGGSMLWGANGVSLTDSINAFQPNPRVAETSDGNFVFIWRIGTGPQKIYMQKLNSSGVKQWGTSPILVTSGTTENYDWPDLVASDNGSIIMYWAGYTGSFFSPANYKLYTQKFSSSGTRVWNSTEDTVYNLGHVSGFYQPRIFSDGNSGAIFCWRDDRNLQNLSTGYLQRMNSSGTFLFPINGSAVSTVGGFNYFDPIASLMASTGETIVVFQEANSGQTQWGFGAQKLSSTGAQLWGSGGISIQSYGSNQVLTYSVSTKDTNAIVYFNQDAGSGNDLIKACRLGKSGGYVWSGNIITPSSILSPKIRLNAALNNSNGLSVLCWEDRRNDAGGIYAQDINLDGTYGTPTGINPFSGKVPEKYGLKQNYPNPFNPVTLINYQLPAKSEVKLSVYDVLGREVVVLVNENQSAGFYNVKFDGTKLASGIYFYKLSAGDFIETKKLILDK